MNSNEKQQQWISFFEDAAFLYEKIFLYPDFEKYRTKDLWESLSVFLEYYAFVRQGCPPYYPYKAVDALEECKKQNKGVFGDGLAKCVWEKFSSKFEEERGKNEKRNPLYFEEGKKKSLIEKVMDKGLPSKNLSLIAYVEREINNNNIRNVFSFLTSIRGIGDKIASLFLRDIAIVMKCELKGKENRELLQPIDIWVRRITKTLIEEKNIGDREVAKYIIEKSNEPERVNEGMWYFGSQIVRSEYYNLERILGKTNEAGNLNEAKGEINRRKKYLKE